MQRKIEHSEVTEMGKSKLLMPLLIVVLLGWFLVPAAHSDAWNKKTIVTFNEPVELPGRVVLQPGTYVMKLADSPSDRHIVQVLNKNENKVFATILAIPNERQQPASGTTITFYETPARDPMFVRSWFYPGDTIGQQFAYPKDRALHIARAANTEVPIAPEGDQEVTTAVTPDNREVAVSTAPDDAATARQEEPPEKDSQSATQEIAQVTQPETGGSTSQSANSAATAPGTREDQLPKTASPVPLYGLIGLLALAGTFVVRFARQRA